MSAGTVGLAIEARARRPRESRVALAAGRVEDSQWPWNSACCHMARQVAILVPVHRASLDADERISLRHLERFLGRYDRYLILPSSLKLAMTGFEVERFPDEFFRSHFDYSRLFLDKRLYRRFAHYEYVLVYQLDCLVFADELEQWCAMGYDYIGAVHEIEGVQMVGNGGFSLRRVAGCLSALESKRQMIAPGAHWQKYWAHRPRHIRAINLPRRYLKYLRAFNGVDWEIRHDRRSATAWPEDWFWSLKAEKYNRAFRKPGVDEAHRFAFFGEPRICFETIGRLPFGCHAWARVDRAFWEPHLLQDA